MTASATGKFVNASSSDTPGIYQLDMTDTNWLLTSSFIIFTMQTGFGLLESGCVSLKNEVNIMMKNIVDIVLGGFTYWLFGYAFSFGRSATLTNPFIGLGDFCVDPTVNDPLMGPIYSAFLFQLSFATTATTIVSGAMAERCNFKAYSLFSFLNTIVYCVPAGWVWGDHGFLNKLGVVDIAGSGPVHLVGGGSAFASAIMLGPRLGRYMRGKSSLPLGNPVNCCLGLFVLWWGWLAFNSGSTYGLEGARWEYAARAAVLTMIASFGGGLFGLLFSMASHGGNVNIMDIINGVLGSLVSITAGCFLYRAYEALIIGIIGALLACITTPWCDQLGLDDPVGASSVHGLCGCWGVLAVGIFAQSPYPLATTSGRNGLLHGGGWYLLGIQAFSCVCLALWSIVTTVLLLSFVNIIFPIRMTVEEELIGADLVEHNIYHKGMGIEQILEALIPIHPNLSHYLLVDVIGRNPGHEAFIKTMSVSNDHSHDNQFIKNYFPRESYFQSDVSKLAWID